MRRVSASLVLAAVLAGLVAAPGSAAAAAPSSSVTKTGECSTLTYAWANHRKAAQAELRIHHFGIFETSRRSGAIGARGSFTVPADVTFIAGDQYTVLGVLLDGAGRTISPSGAVWWGTC